VVVFHKFICADVQRHLWWFFTSLSAKWFSAIFGGFSQVYLCSASPPSVLVFASLPEQYFSAICGGFSQASMRRRTERNGPAGQV
jgi:hypothetical protein